MGETSFGLARMKTRECLLLVLVAASLLLSCYERHTIAEIKNDHFTVVAQWQTSDATTLPATIISYGHPLTARVGEKELARLIGSDEKTALDFVTDNILLVSNFDDYWDRHKYYILSNLDSPPRSTFKLYRMEWEDLDTIWSDSSSTANIVLTLLYEPAREFHLSCDTYPKKSQVFVLGAKEIEGRVEQPGQVLLRIVWRDGSVTENLKLLLPIGSEVFLKAEAQEG